MKLVCYPSTILNVSECNPFWLRNSIRRCAVSKDNLKLNRHQEAFINLTTPVSVWKILEYDFYLKIGLLIEWCKNPYFNEQKSNEIILNVEDDDDVSRGTVQSIVIQPSCVIPMKFINHSLVDKVLFQIVLGPTSIQSLNQNRRKTV